MTTLPTRMRDWRKSSRSSGKDTCVEVYHDLAAVRDSKQHGGPVLRGNVAALIEFVKAGHVR